MLQAFLHGYFLAFGLIIPLGPQNTFVFTQGANQYHWTRTIPVVIAAAFCDTILITVAVLGVSAAVITLPWLKWVLVIAGVCFLTVVGWLTWRHDPGYEPGDPLSTGWSTRQQVMFAVSISLLNPHAILDTIGVIGTSALSYPLEIRWAFASACILNSWLWFAGLAATGRLVGKVEPVRKLLNRASAIIMWGSAIYLAFSLIGR